MQAKTEQMEKSVRVAERDYSKKMAELNRGFEVCSFLWSILWYSIVPTLHIQGSRPIFLRDGD